MPTFYLSNHKEFIGLVWYVLKFVYFYFTISHLPREAPILDYYVRPRGGFADDANFEGGDNAKLPETSDSASVSGPEARRVSEDCLNAVGKTNHYRKLLLLKGSLNAVKNTIHSQKSQTLIPRPSIEEWDNKGSRAGGASKLQ